MYSRIKEYHNKHWLQTFQLVERLEEILNNHFERTSSGTCFLIMPKVNRIRLTYRKILPIDYKIHITEACKDELYIFDTEPH